VLKLLAHCALLATASAAAAAGGAEPGHREAISFAPTRAVLVLIPGPQAVQSLAVHRPQALDPASTPEADLVRECADGESQRALSERSLVFDIAVRTWRLLLHPLAVSVHDELQKYAQISGASASADYYRGGDSSASAPLSSRVSCVRFTRFTDSSSDEVALDFVAGVRLDRGRDAIRLRPLRLYISQGAAKSANGQYSVAIALRADAVWRDEFTGHQGTVFEHTVAAESIDLRKGSFLKYYPLDAESGVRVPIVPVSFAADRSHDFGRTEFTVSVVELGTPPATLTLLAEMLPDPQESVTKLLVAAATAGSRSQ
jgi:hypothetical protein